MASIGMNVARDGSSNLNAVTSLNCTWIRIVAMPDVDLTEYLRQAKSRNLKVMLVLARESFSYPSPQAQDIRLYRDRYVNTGLVQCVQVGNEPDLTSGSSWTMNVRDFVELGKLVRQILPDTTLISGGLASGHTDWLQGVDLSWCDVIAVHPYAKDAANPGDLEDLPDAQDLIAEYKQYNKPIIVSEWGWWDNTEPRASSEVQDMISWAAKTSDIGSFFYFCLSDAMVPPFGLLNADMSPKPRYVPFRTQAKNAIIADSWSVHSTTPQPQPGPTVDPWQYFTPQQIATASNCPLPNVVANWPKLVEQMDHAGINDRATQIAMIGTVAIESAHTFQPVREAFWNSEEWRRTNLAWYYPYYGRGYIQLTWRENYAAYGPAIAELWGAGGWEPDFNLVGNPDNALNPDIAAAVSALYFRDHGGKNARLIPQAAARQDWTEVRRLVQGGSAGLSDFAQICSTLWVLPIPGTPEVPEEPTPDPVDGYRTAIAYLVDVVLPKAAASAAEREEALAEGQRVKAQFLGPD